ncbi:hypothetical protein [Nocardia sp. NBC_01009]|uniref:hypothetical protein n=1 Tax=Nocardia sp. NBC_01009 TaxID=2975996 RepID=UPI00386D0F0B|nr:hypothetical protein OHA42_14480 [Nocardia sp. NBC_01009]
MSTSSEKRTEAEAWARFERLSTIDEVLFDMNQSAWESMERNDFADTEGERAKLAYLKKVGPSVRDEKRDAWHGWMNAHFGQETADRIRARAAQKFAEGRTAPDLSQPTMRGIERSR